MAFTENWIAQGLGVEGTAGWNKYGSAQFFGAGAYRYNSFTIGSIGLQHISTVTDPLNITSSIYTCHGVSADTVFGNFSCNYSTSGLQLDSTPCITMFSLAQNASTGSILWVKDELTGTSTRTVSFKVGPGIGSATSHVWSASETNIEGVWSQTGLGIDVKYVGDGTWQGSFRGTVGGVGTIMVITGKSSQYGTYIPSNMQLSIRQEFNISTGEGEYVWHCPNITFPFSNAEFSSPSQVAYVGTWVEDTVVKVGYLSLGDRLLSSSDIVDYAYLPMEYRGWSSSCSVELADTDEMIRTYILGDLIGTWHSSARLVMKEQWNGTWNTLFTGYLSSQPEYDYQKKTAKFETESVLGKYTESVFDNTKSPYTAITAYGSFEAYWGDGTYSLLIDAEAPTELGINDIFKLKTGVGIYGSEYMTVSSAEPLVFVNDSSGWRTKFSIKEPVPIPGIYQGRGLYRIRAWPTPSQLSMIRADPAYLVTSLISNLGLCIEQDSSFANWQTIAGVTPLGDIPKVFTEEKVLPLFNEVCAAFNTSYTVSPEGRIRLFSMNAEPPRTVEINLGEHYSDKFSITTYPPIGAVNVSYGFDESTFAGPENEEIIESRSTFNFSTTESISTRFLDSNIAAMVTGYRAIRRFENAVPVITLDLDGSRWASLNTGDGVELVGASDFLGSAAPLGGVWSVITKQYSYQNDQTSVTLMARFPVKSWVTWGSSIEYNTGLRWF